MEGWIKLYRQVLDNPIVCKDSDHIAVWMYILLNATHKEYPVVFSGNKIFLQPGQLITGRKVIAEKFKISESKVQRILKVFESEQQIEQQNGNKNRLISVLSWSDYQSSEQQDEQLLNNKRTTTEQQVNTNKNVKNIENVKELKPIVDSNECDLAFEQFYNSYPKGSGSIKKESLKSWNKVWKGKPDVDEMLDGLERYLLHQKALGRNICGAQVFLNQERWKEDWVIPLVPVNTNKSKAERDAEEVNALKLRILQGGAEVAATNETRSRVDVTPNQNHLPKLYIEQ